MSGTLIGSQEQLAAIVREALSERYAAPVLRELADGRVAVPAGPALGLARAAASRAGLEAGEAARRIVAIDVAGLPWHPVPDGGLRLWRQHGREAGEGELVTEVQAGDPAYQVIAGHADWSLVRLVDGASGWVREALLDAGAVHAATAVTAPRVDRPLPVRDFIAQVEHLLGVPYVWGGTAAGGVDCSGLVQRAAWAAGGPWLPRHSRALLAAGARVAPSRIAAGDVLVLRRLASTMDDGLRAQLDAQAAAERRHGAVPAHGPAVHPMHVAVVVSGNEVVHASRDAMRVVREPLASIRQRYRILGVRRFGGDVPAGEE